MAYLDEMVEFVSFKEGTLMKWWNHQRMWMIKGVTCFPVALLEFCLQKIGFSAAAFNVTNKSIDDAQSMCYEKGVFDFGVWSPFFLLLATMAGVNLVVLVVSVVRCVMEGGFGEVLVQVFLCVGVVVNCLPVYEAMMNCEGWKSVFCDPDEPAFLGDVPSRLNDVLSQHKRWMIGLLEVAFSKHNPLIYFIKTNPIAGFTTPSFLSGAFP
ncbi:Cellulose synthase-like protein G1 [Acorus gramineus]|uniref:Cellulose synthase-like protein G1 n=1 Tax=Acorus gramineus TaxID=55184 RepID=A0AAV9A277_ACOGR|nr:Cellulose synthase-like protein G1 [Acorus gramineus]